MSEYSRLPDPADVSENEESVSLKRKKKIRKRVLTILFVLLNIVIIGAAAFVDFRSEHTTSAPHSLDLRYLLLAVWCLLLLMATETLKYYIMMKKLNGSASVRTAFEVTALGRYYNSVTPTGAGGQPFQIYYLNKKNVSTTASASMPIADFLTLQFSFIILAVIVFIFGKPFLTSITEDTITIMISAYIGIASYSAVPSLIILFIIFPKTVGAIVRFTVNVLSKLRIIRKPDEAIEKSMATITKYRQSVVTICKTKSLLLILLGFGFVYHIALCSIAYFVLLAFGSQLSYLSVVAMMIMIYCAITYIPTPGNAGAAEVSFLVLLANLNQSNLFWAMLFWRILTYYSLIATGGGILAFEAIKNRMINNKETMKTTLEKQ